MRLSDYVRVLRKRLWLIGLVALVSASAAYGFSKLQAPLYRAQTSWIVVPNREDYGLSLLLPSTMNSWNRLILSDRSLTQLSDELALDLRPERLIEYIHIQNRPDERVVLIQADHPSGEQAVALANAIGRKLQTEISNLNLTKEGTDRINITLAEAANEYTLARPRTRINVLAGAVLGMILGTLLAFLADYLDDTLKTAEDIERVLGMSTIGQIPSAGDDAAGSGQRRRPGSRLLKTG